MQPHTMCTLMRSTSMQFGCVELVSGRSCCRRQPHLDLVHGALVQEGLDEGEYKVDDGAGVDDRRLAQHLGVIVLVHLGSTEAAAVIQVLRDSRDRARDRCAQD
jgi:hypothetical protein